MAKSIATQTTARGRPGPEHSPGAQGIMSAKAAIRKRKTTAPAADMLASAEQRQQIIAEAAYYISERRGFAPGCELDDWLQAEAEFEAQLRVQAELQ